MAHDNINPWDSSLYLINQHSNALADNLFLYFIFLFFSLKNDIMLENEVIALIWVFNCCELK